MKPAEPVINIFIAAYYITYTSTLLHPHFIIPPFLPVVRFHDVRFYGIIAPVLASKAFLSAALAAAIAALAVDSAWADFSFAPKAAVSSDGFIRVVAEDDPRDEVGFRLPILAYAGKTLDAISKAFDIKRTRVSEPGLIIYAMGGRTNDTRVIVRHETRKSGSDVLKIFLPSPGYSDLEELRIGIARSFLGNGLPDWVVQGVLRSEDDDTRREDERFVLQLWSSARLPFFPALCSDLRAGKGRAAALPGYMAGWIREKKLLKKLTEEKWDGARLAILLTGETDPMMQDRASDERLARLARSVLQPGDCGIWELDFFSSRLSLYSPVFNVKIARGDFSCPFRDAIYESGTNLLLRAAAFLKAREVPLYALGRGEELQSVAQAYTMFLFSLAGGEDAQKLHALLDSADSRLEKAYEKRRKDNHR